MWQTNTAFLFPCDAHIRTHICMHACVSIIIKISFFFFVSFSVLLAATIRPLALQFFLKQYRFYARLACERPINMLNKNQNWLECDLSHSLWLIVCACIFVWSRRTMLMLMPNTFVANFVQELPTKENINRTRGDIERWVLRLVNYIKHFYSFSVQFTEISFKRHSFLVSHLNRSTVLVFLFAHIRNLCAAKRGRRKKNDRENKI